MLFNSLEFIIFFPLVTVLYFLVPHKFRWIWLLAASCVFYAAFIPSYLLILLLLILIDYSAGLLIEKGNNRKLWLIVSIVANIALLAIFKYYNFLIGNINSLTGSHYILLHWALPIGLSFHTFQSMSYTIEVYRRNQAAIKHPGYYALYVMFYPQLVAGPIERPRNLLPQLFKKQEFSAQHLYEGLRLMAWGFFKKTVIADRIGQFADAVFNHPAGASPSSTWLAVLFFSIQIYADFSGYSDIAIGAARCMGIDLSINFNRPYQSTNIHEFWKRWHISLSSWFRDYVYIPLGGNRKGAFRRNVNIMLTFILSAFWHGAGWTFITWGILHGMYTLLYEALKKIKIPAAAGWLTCFILVCFAWIFFRASSLQNARDIITSGSSLTDLSFSNMLSIKGTGIEFGNFSLLLSFGMIVYMFIVEKYTHPKMFDLNEKKIADIFLFTGTLLLIIFFGVFHKSSFIYFQF